MAHVRYVCISDLHLGEEDSILTRWHATHGVQPEETSPVLSSLADCLEVLLVGSTPRPTLVLNGDALELALARTNEAAQVFAEAIRVLVVERKLFRKVILIPGNHDHHLWETARETQYVNYLRRLPAGVSPAEPWHTTKVMMDYDGPDHLTHNLLTTVAQKFGGASPGFEVRVAYPNLGVAADINGVRRAVVFHHGHLIEKIYLGLSVATTYVNPEHKAPVSVYEMEAENFAWIDFLWSTLGRSGAAGKHVEQIYESTKDPKRLRALAGELAKNIAAQHDVPLVPGDHLERKVLRKLLRWVAREIAGKLERQDDNRAGGIPLSDDTLSRLGNYAFETLDAQFEAEDVEHPDVLTFIFGHTHKPFTRRFDFGTDRTVDILNTGGWVVDGNDDNRLHGAGIVLVNDRLEAVNVRLYNEGDYSAYVEEASGDGEPETAFLHDIGKRLHPRQKPWSTLAADIRRAVRKRHNRRARGKA